VSEDSRQPGVKDGLERGYGAAMDALASEWMTRAKHGDDAAFDQLTQALRGRAFQIARSWVGSPDEALELAQEAFLKTYRARDTFREGEPFLPWFHRILRNTCFSFLRKERRLKRASLSSRSEEGEADWEIEDEGPAPERGAEASEESRIFWEGFRTLRARDREILTLRHFQDLPYADIARVLGIPEGTVMSRLFHARKRLRKALAHYFEDENESPPPSGGAGDR
jgi:RNA polymerase sigma-70 factor (ECF subfamily)